MNKRIQCEDDMLNHDVESNILLRLIRAALRSDADQTVELDAECDAEKLADIIVRQSLVTLVYPVIERQTAASWQLAREKLKPVYDRELHKGMVQEYEIQTLLDDMERDGIDCLPMKGWIMRNYYPNPLMRSMGDLDVLLKDMDSEKMQKWMEARGYEVVHSKQTFHDEYIKPPYMYVELHHELIDKLDLQPPEIAWLDRMTPSFWQDGSLAEGKKHQYQLSDELFYIHHISHFYKHFTRLGVGIRPVIDLYFLLTKKSDTLDWNYINKQLKELHLYDFSEKMKMISWACFQEKRPLDEQTMLVVRYLTGSGLYGDQLIRESLSIANDQYGSKNVAVRMLKRCFLPLKQMKNQYSCLYRYPILLPVCWLRRIARIVFLQNEKMRVIGISKHAESEEIQENIKAIYVAAGIGQDR